MVRGYHGSILGQKRVFCCQYGAMSYVHLKGLYLSREDGESGEVLGWPKRCFLSQLPVFEPGLLKPASVFQTLSVWFSLLLGYYWATIGHEQLLSCEVSDQEQ